MSQEKLNLEDIFQSAFRHETIKPSAAVLRRLRFKLMVSDFMHFSFTKINIYYASAILTGSVITALVLNDKPENTSLAFSAVNQLKAETAFLPDKSSKTNAELGPSKVEKVLVVNLEKKEAKLMALFSPSVTKGCAPLEVNFRNQSAIAASVLWNFGNGETSSEINPRYKYNSAGNYKATLTLKDSDGNTASYSKDISVFDAAHADFTIDTDLSDIRTRKIVFINKSKGGSTYIWDFGDRANSGEQKPIHTYTNYENYTVTLIASTEKGCTDTARFVNKFIEKNYELAFPLNFRPNPNNSNIEGYYEVANAEGGIFYPVNNGVSKYEMKIIAPNGIIVFTTNTIKQGWTGFMGGRLAPSGVYFYEASGIYPNGKKFNLKGQVKVIVDEQYLE